MSLIFLAVRDGVPLAFLALWAASIAAVRADARLRISNRSGRRAAVALAVALPFLGAFLYRAVRPAETRLQRRERRLAELLLELELDGYAAEPRKVVALPAREPEPVAAAAEPHAVAV
jgi:hypothetical protein